MFMEEDINLLMSMDHWVSVVPHKGKWRGVIWKKTDGGWKEYKSRVQTNPTKCYEWSANIFMKLMDKHEKKDTY